MTSLSRCVALLSLLAAGGCVRTAVREHVAATDFHGTLGRIFVLNTLDGAFAVQSRYDGDVRAGTYIVRLQDVAERRDLWRGEMVLSSSASFVTDRSGAGALFADRLVRQMAEDRVLTGCPPAPREG